MSMKRFAWFVALMATAVLAGSSSGDYQSSLGPGQTTVIDNPAPDDICPGATFKINGDGSYENGYAWEYIGNLPPYYGAWAEGFTMDPGNAGVCGIRVDLTQTGNQDDWLMDVYVWDAFGGNPNNILSMTPGVNPGPIAIWPEISQHDIDINDIYVAGDYFVGEWGNWFPVTGWYIAADEDGPADGLPRTNIAPGIGYTTGWNHVNVAFPHCQDLGIGTYEVETVVPVRETSWGSVKSLYR